MTSETLWAEFEDKEFRDAYASSAVDSTVATQIKLLRGKLTQKELAEKAGMKQSRISAMEDVNYSSWNVSTLKRLASAFDCALIVRFASFDEVIASEQEMSVSSLSVPTFSESLDRRKAVEVALMTQITDYGWASAQSFYLDPGAFREVTIVVAADFHNDNKIPSSYEAHRVSTLSSAQSESAGIEMQP